jgi:4-hydroxy-2-oxoheptanedioate aldolase
MTNRINKVIELLEQNQPVYYTVAPDVSYEGGKALAKTFADYIQVSMEHNIYDMNALGAFMQGLIDGGPTASGHRTPAVCIDLPLEGSSEADVRANAWMCKQALCQGVHGVILCHAESPDAVRAFVQACRFPFQTAGMKEGDEPGRRGAGGQMRAAEVWGIPPDDYLLVADPWPLNPKGEIMLGLKIENKRALANAETTAKVPGIIFAEWGPGDMGMSLGYPNAHDPPYSPDMEKARNTVKSACQNAGIHFLEGAHTDDVSSKIDEGVMFMNCYDHETGVKTGRAHTKRTMPV